MDNKIVGQADVAGSDYPTSLGLKVNACRIAPHYVVGNYSLTLITCRGEIMNSILAVLNIESVNAGEQTGIIDNRACPLPVD